MKKKNLLISIFLIFLLVHITTLLNIDIVEASSKDDFIREMSKAAVEDMKATGVYASVTLGQGAVESGWGSNSIATKYKNYFGMKTGSSIYVNGVQTTCNAANYGVIGKANSENPFWSGTAVCLGASEGGYSWFRVYDSMANSVKDHSRNLWCISDGRYVKNGVFASPDPQTQLYNIARSGYAVDKYGNVTVTAGRRYDDYIYNLIIKPNDFEQYDQEYQQIKPDYAYDCTTAEYTGSMPSIMGSTSIGLMSLSTSYDGNIKEGYINLNQKNNSLIYHDDATDDTIKGKVLYIINNIFKKASEYGGSSSSSYGDYDVVQTGGETNPLNWKQTSTTWGSIPLGKSKYTISSAGCLATSVAIQIKRSGTSLSTSNFNPGTFVNAMNASGGFTNGGLFRWQNDKWSKVAPNFEVAFNPTFLPNSKKDKINKIKEYLNNNYYLVMCVKKDCGHWVAVTGVTDNDIIMADPGSNSTSVFSKYNVKNVTKVAAFKKTD